MIFYPAAGSPLPAIASAPIVSSPQDRFSSRALFEICGAEVRSVNLYVAQGAGLEKGVLIVERWSSGRTAETRSGMALQAQQVYVAHLQHVRIRAPMRHVAGLASIHLHYFMLEYKRSLLVGVAFEADRILRRRVPYLLGFHRPVHVVAVAADQQAFVDAMVKGHFELRLLLQVAPVAEFRLGFHQQEFLGLRVVW
jgi:hypothetical protein